MNQSVIWLIIYVSQLHGSVVHFYLNSLVLSSVQMLCLSSSIIHFSIPYQHTDPTYVSLSLLSG